MSEDFDKEAEREKLRKKYERDKEKREATEQMSELLLQGATMTNAHCSQCGDPIFRYEGQEFCPTCEKPVDRGGAEGEESSDEGEQIEVTSPSDDARVSFGEDGTAEGATDDAGAEATVDDASAEETPDHAPEAGTTEEATVPGGQSRRRESAESRSPAAEPAGEEATQRRRAPRQRPQSPPATEEGSVEAAREALVGTLTRFSQRAAATDDPARAQEHLAAAREAAEALAALRQ